MTEPWVRLLLMGSMLAACGGGQREVVVQQQPTIVAVAVQPTTVSLQVRNASPQTICYLYISPVSDPNWGPDQLGSSVLAPGQVGSFSFTAGQWDIKGENCQHQQLIYMRNVTIAANMELVLQ